MNINEIAAAYWTNGQAVRELAERAKDILDELQAGAKPIGSTKLQMALMPHADDKQIKSILNKLQLARDKGFMDGYFDRGKKGMYGKPSVLWHAKVQHKWTDEERREAQRQLMAEIALDNEDTNE